MFYPTSTSLRGRGQRVCSMTTSDVREEGGPELHVLWTTSDVNPEEGGESHVLPQIHIRCQRGRGRESCSIPTSDVLEEGGESHVLFHIRCQRGRGREYVLTPHQMSRGRGREKETMSQLTKPLPDILEYASEIWSPIARQQESCSKSKQFRTWH